MPNSTITQLDKIQHAALAEIQKSTSLEALKSIEIKYLGRKGELTELLKGLKNLSAEEKRTTGPITQQLKIKIESAIKTKQAQLESAEIATKLSGEFFDITAPGIEH